MENDTLKTTILAMLDKFVRQRSGMEFANYGDLSSYRSEQRSITRDLQDYRTLARRVQWSGITGEQLREAFRAFSGRLRLTQRDDGTYVLDYCTGQYFPTEYRKAACAVLASALWDYTREQCMPDPTYTVNDGTRQFSTLDAAKAHAETYAPNFVSIESRYSGISAGDWLRTYFRKEFGRGIASRWFS